jgi:hypothetical protein
MKTTVFVFSIIFLWVVPTAFGQLLHADIQRIYNFEPHKLSSAEREAKSKLVDEFWAKVSREKSKYLPALRMELNDTTNSPFFLYDGSHLLLSLTKTKNDYALALSAMSQVSLADIDLGDYVQTMNSFAGKGLNTTSAALKIIPIDSYRAYLPAHALTLDKGLSLRFMLLPIKSEWYLNRVIEALATVRDDQTVNQILDFLFYTCTCQGDAVIARYATDKNQPKVVRKQAALLVEWNKVKRHDNPAKYVSLRNKRQTALSRVSEEALSELDEVSKELKEQYICR